MIEELEPCLLRVFRSLTGDICVLGKGGSVCVGLDNCCVYKIISQLCKRVESLEKCLAKFPKWDRDFPVGCSTYKGLYEFNSIIAEAEELLKGTDHE